MLWKKRRKGTTVVDPALTAAHADTRDSLETAEQARDQQQAKLKDERRTVTGPLRQARETNHLAELAMSALLRRHAQSRN